MKKQTQSIITGIIFIIAGIIHFVIPKFYLQIMPPYLPYHLVLVYLSGLAEIVCGTFLIPKKTRRIGAWLTIALLIAIFPANVQMSIDSYSIGGLMFYVSVFRLPLQFLMVWWVYNITHSLNRRLQ